MERSSLDNFCPPDTPEVDEQLAARDPHLAEVGRERMAGIVKGRIVWERELFTRSKKWGLIWRADFSEPDRQVPIPPTRVVQWIRADGEVSVLVSSYWGKGALKLRP